eukprot:3772779-Rhodomonas_salina.2
MKKNLEVTRDALPQMADLRSPSRSSSSEDVQEAISPAHRVPFRLTELYDVIPGRLALTVHGSEEETKAEIKRLRTVYLFSSDLQDRFEPFCADFGPVKLSVVHQFCNFVRERIFNPKLAKRKLAYYCDNNAEAIANTAFLLGCFAMLDWDYSPEQAYDAFSRISPSPFPGFRDATYRPADYTISLLDCFRGLRHAMALGWYSQESFSLDEYEHWDIVGDLHEVTPKFVAFRGPQSKETRFLASRVPENYVQVFKYKGVSAVVRLNDKDTYDARKFTKSGIRHYDLFFEDCSTPSTLLIKQFLDICDREPGRIAVHCKAGLGRTGTMIALWMMRKLAWKADEAIAWIRIVRPGSVIGAQQHFLKSCESASWDGNMLRSNESCARVLAEQAAMDARELETALIVRGLGSMHPGFDKGCRTQLRWDLGGSLQTTSLKA